MEGRSNSKGMGETEMGATTAHTHNCLPFHSLHVSYMCISVV